jgi:hypothetical protein
MKKLIVLVVVVMLLGSCGVSQQDYDAMASQVNALQSQLAMSEQTDSEQNTVESTPSPEPTIEPTPVSTPETGTRKNPASIGQVITGSLTKGGDPLCSYELCITSVIRGESAWEAIKKANQFNDEPTEGFEYILVSVRVKNTMDLSGNDEPLEINRYDFDLARSDDSIDSNQPIVVLPTPELDAKLYEGSEDEGYIAFLVNKSDLNVKTIFIESDWFLLQ